jgi:hypothetical protein
MGTVIRPGRSLNWTFDQGYDYVIAASDFGLLRGAAQAQVGGFRKEPPKPAGRRAGS